MTLERPRTTPIDPKTTPERSWNGPGTTTERPEMTPEPFNGPRTTSERPLGLRNLQGITVTRIPNYTYEGVEKIVIRT